MAFTQLLPEVPPISLNGKGVELSLQVIPPVSVQEKALAGNQLLSFLMGARGYDPDEEPRHRVIIPKPFYLATLPVTKDQAKLWLESASYEQWKADHPNCFDIGDRVRPPSSGSAAIFNWFEAVGFCDWINEECSSQLPEDYFPCMPPEAWWEYAMRADSTTDYWWGDGIPTDFDNHEPHPWGLQGLPDVTWEWCDNVKDGMNYAKRPANYEAVEEIDSLNYSVATEQIFIQARSVRLNAALPSKLGRISWRDRWFSRPYQAQQGTRICLAHKDFRSCQTTRRYLKGYERPSKIKYVWLGDSSLQRTPLDENQHKPNQKSIQPNMINRTPKETQQDLLDEVVLRELANRSPEIAPLITDASHYLASPPKKGELLTLRPEEYAPAHAKAPPVAVYLDAKKSVQCVPLDPLVISYYRLPLIQEDLESLGLRYPFGPDFTMCRQLRLVDKLSGIPSEINTAQLIALQSLLGNLSTWWPITAYSSEDLRTIFSTLDLGVLYHHSRPVGVAHLDFSHGASDEAKVVFMAVDPKLHGNRLGAALLVQTLSYAYQKGVRCIYLDTVPHRDIGYSKGSSIETMPVSGFYEKFGFQLIRSEMIDPGSPPPGVEINQLNAPLGYQLDDSELRRMIDETFPLPL